MPCWCPERALAYDQGGYYLLVVNSENKVEQRYVTPGSKEEGALRVIEENLKADDLVIIQGLQRARPGIAVNPKTPGDRRPAGASAEDRSQAAARRQHSSRQSLRATKRPGT